MSETRQPWTPGPIPEEYIRAALRHIGKHADIDVLGVEHLAEAIDSGSVRIPSYHNGDPKLFAHASELAEALAKFVLGYEHALRRRGDKTSPADPPVIASARAALEACGWQWGGR